MAILMASPRDHARYVSPLGMSYLRHEVYAYLGDRMEVVRRSLPPDARLLIVGTGGGVEEPWIGSYPYQTLDVDPAQHADITADICATGLPAGSVPAIVLSQVLEHVPDPVAALGECDRILVPGGHLLITTPWDYPYHNDDRQGDYWRISDDGLRWLLRGWSVLSLERRKFGAFAHAVKGAAT